MSKFKSYVADPRAPIFVGIVAGIVVAVMSVAVAQETPEELRARAEAEFQAAQSAAGAQNIPDVPDPTCAQEPCPDTLAAEEEARRAAEEFEAAQLAAQQAAEEEAARRAAEEEAARVAAEEEEARRLAEEEERYQDLGRE